MCGGHEHSFGRAYRLHHKGDHRDLVPLKCGLVFTDCTVQHHRKTAISNFHFQSEYFVLLLFQVIVYVYGSLIL